MQDSASFELLERAKHPCCFLSGGIDSILALSLARAIRDTPVIVFGQDFSKVQWRIIENLIREWDLEVIMFAPRASYIIPNGKTLARVDEYAFPNMVIPIVREFMHSNKCGLEMNKERMNIYPYFCDVVVTGGRKTDWQPATGQIFHSEVLEINGTKFVQPLFDWTDEEIREAAKGLPYSKEWYSQGRQEFDTGTVAACTNCLTEGKVYCPKEKKEIEATYWNRDAMLGMFQERFGYGQ